MRTDEEHERAVRGNRQKRMDDIDGLPPETRALVHAYGWTVVKAFMDIGVTKPKHIRHIVERVLDEFSPTRGTFTGQGIRHEKIVPLR
jgi:hypothetical protein